MEQDEPAAWAEKKYKEIQYKEGRAQESEDEPSCDSAKQECKTGGSWSVMQRERKEKPGAFAPPKWKGHVPRKGHRGLKGQKATRHHQQFPWRDTEGPFRKASWTVVQVKPRCSAFGGMRRTQMLVPKDNIRVDTLQLQPRGHPP